MAAEKVKFGGGMAMAGVFGGVAIAVGLPAVLVLWGRHLPATLVGGIIIIALTLGSIAVIVSGFFASVMPKEVEGGAGDTGGVHFDFRGSASEKPGDPAAPKT